MDSINNALDRHVQQMLKDLDIAELKVHPSEYRSLKKLDEIFNGGIDPVLRESKNLIEHPTRDRQRSTKGMVEYKVFRQPERKMFSTDQVLYEQQGQGFCPANLAEMCRYIEYRNEQVKDPKWKTLQSHGRWHTQEELICFGSTVYIEHKMHILTCSAEFVQAQDKYIYRLRLTPEKRIWGLGEWFIFVKNNY
ncbi:MAG TPA: hypothetical protein PLR08_01775 [bacterium]|nr:hypothetical protein [Candidatus Magasanikbacteria bacterium]MCA9389704.1 hypothetical protein [Candidatus Magasanikbacteria bacterium]HPF95260.1 hypothetical protein [bacterium]